MGKLMNPICRTFRTLGGVALFVAARLRTHQLRRTLDGQNFTAVGALLTPATAMQTCSDPTPCRQPALPALDTRVDPPTSVPLTLGRELFQPDKYEKIVEQFRSDKDNFRAFFEGEMNEILIVEGLLSAERIRQISKTGKYQPR
jgi:hypothetical protein